MPLTKQNIIDQLEKKLAKTQAKLDKQTQRASWYRSKLLKFVTTKWIKQEKWKDGFQERR